jgi:hypothetical protein
MKKSILFTAICFLFCVSGQAYGDGFWCDGKLISTGNNKYEVLSKCGEPDYKEARFEKRIRRDFYRDLFRSRELPQYREREQYREPLFVEEEVMIEEWTYNLGPTRFIRYLTFENGRLVDISTGDYGF